MTTKGQGERFAYVWGRDGHLFFPLLPVQPEWLCQTCNAVDGDLKKRGWCGINRRISSKYLTLSGTSIQSIRLLRGHKRRAAAVVEYNKTKKLHAAAIRDIVKLAHTIA